MNPILVDTGPLVAILSQTDRHHGRCVEELQRIRGRLLTCWPVIVEACWLLRAYPGAIETLLSSFQEELLELAPLNESDLQPIAGILAKHADLGLQLADASLVHLANRDRIDTVFTLDRRDFSVIRLARGKRLHLIP